MFLLNKTTVKPQTKTGLIDWAVARNVGQNILVNVSVWSWTSATLCMCEHRDRYAWVQQWYNITIHRFLMQMQLECEILEFIFFIFMRIFSQFLVSGVIYSPWDPNFVDLIPAEPDGFFWGRGSLGRNSPWPSLNCGSQVLHFQAPKWTPMKR